MAYTAPTFTIYDSSVREESTCFGSFTFTHDSPTQRLAFSSFHEGIDPGLGDMWFRVSSVDTIRIPYLIRLATADSTSSSIIPVSHASSSVGSSSELKSTPILIYYVDYDAHHIVGPSDFTWGPDDGSSKHESCYRRVPSPCFVGAVIEPGTGDENTDAHKYRGVAEIFDGKYCPNL
jgi:hypothetical protein